MLITLPTAQVRYPREGGGDVGRTVERHKAEENLCKAYRRKMQKEETNTEI